MFALALSLTGCSLTRRSETSATAEPWNTTVPSSLQPQLVRFQTELGTRAVGQGDSPRAELTLFSAAVGAIVNNYVDPVDPVQLIDAAIVGMGDAPNATTSGDAGALVEARL